MCLICITRAMATMDRMPTVIERVRQHALQSPDRAAVIFGGHSLTYAELDRRSDSVARALTATGLGRGARIALLAKNTPTFYELALGAGKLGVVLVPINYRLAPAEIAYLLADSGAELLFVSGEYAGAVAGIAADLPNLRDTILVDGPDYPCGAYKAWRDAHGGAPVAEDPPDDAVALQMYTSGTTARPKGALLTHANLSEALRGVIPAWGPWGETDVILVCMPQYHIGAGIWGLGGLWLGVESVLTREFHTSEILGLIPRHRITKTQLASVMMKMMIEDPACAATDFSSLELITYGAAPAPLALVRQAQETFGCGLAQGYGMTETAGTITWLSPEDHAGPVGERISSAGRALSGVEIRVCGPNGEALPPGEIGEVACRGPQVTHGYWRLPAATAEAIRDGWLRTGDAGYLDEHGYLFIRDRVKDMIVSGGENIYPAEVEGVLYAHPDVSDVAVIGVPDEHWGEVGKAFVVARPASAPREEDLLAFARERIARFKVPRSVEFVEGLPRNASGKVLKRELRRPYWEGRESAVV